MWYTRLLNGNKLRCIMQRVSSLPPAEGDNSRCNYREVGRGKKWLSENIDALNRIMKLLRSEFPVIAAKHAMGGLSLLRFLQWFLSTFGQEHMASDRWIEDDWPHRGQYCGGAGVIFHGNRAHKNSEPSPLPRTTTFTQLFVESIAIKNQLQNRKEETNK